jgi:hypothetical protein
MKMAHWRWLLQSRLRIKSPIRLARQNISFNCAGLAG